MRTLKLTQKLTKAENKHLKEILEKEKFLSKLEDKNIFEQDYKDRDKTKDSLTPGFVELIDKEVGPCLIPLYQLERSIGSSFIVNEQRKRYKKVKFSIALSQDPRSPKNDFVFLGVYKRRLPSLFIYNCYLNRHSGPSNISTTALAFYNKENLYETLRRIIKTNEKVLETRFGKSLTNDITKLFSIGKSKQNINNLALKPLLVEEICETKNEDKKLDKYKCVKSFTIKYKFDKSYANVGIMIYLTNENNLSIYNTLMASNKTIEPIKWTSGGIPEFMDTKKYKKFAIRQTKNCIDSMDSMTSFGMKIYRKFETKILITI